MHPPSSETCLPASDSRAFTLSVFLALGTLCSYLPQHFRIIWNRKSTGLNPLFLLLGATSSASSLLNIVALSWYAVRCCSFLTSRQCFEGTLGITQVAVQWLCFNVVFVLYLVYYPTDKRWVSWVPGSVPEARPSKLWRNIKRAFRPANYTGDDEPSSPESDASFDFRNVSYAAVTSRRSIQPAETAASPEWRMSMNYAVLTGLHLAVCGFVTLLLLLLLPKASNPPVHPDPDPLPGPHQESHDARLVRLWATFLGLLSTLLALFQYIPQIVETWQSKIVGSLSIPMMLIQTPGSALFVYSLVIRPGVNWTAWAVYMITGILQGILLLICIAFTIRLRRAGLDAWGKPLNGDSTAFEEDEHRPLLQ